MSRTADRRKRKPSAQRRTGRIAAGLAVVAATAGLAAIPSNASRTKKCKVVSSPSVAGSTAVGKTLRAHHGKWVCQT